jgi:hypothetical protein
LQHGKWVVPVTAGPGSQGPADPAAGGYLRASHAGREHVIGVLKAAFVQGMLTKAELDERAGQAFASRTLAGLAAITADLPAGLIGAQPPRKPAPAQAPPPVSRALMRTACAIVLAAVASIIAGFPAQSVFLLQVGVFAFLIAAPVAATLMLDLRRANRSGGQLPPGPPQFGRGLGSERDGGPGNDLILCQAHRDTPAGRLFGHGVSQRIWPSVPARGASAG